MTIEFVNIPAGDEPRTPLFYADLATRRTFTAPLRSLLIGQRLGGAAVNDTLYKITSIDYAVNLFGRASMLERMVRLYRQSDAVGELWAVSVDDPAGGTAAQGAIVINGTATRDGVIGLHIAGQRVALPVSRGQAAALVASNLAYIINNRFDLPVTAGEGTVSSNGVSVRLNCKWPGESGNDCTIHLNHSNADKVPRGLTVEVTPLLNSGLGLCDLSGALTAITNEPFEFIIHPFNDLVNIAAVSQEMARRWSAGVALYGHAYTALSSTYSALGSFGDGLNDAHLTLAGIDPDCPCPAWEYAASYGARNALYIRDDPGRPTQGGVLSGIVPPRTGFGFSFAQRDALLFRGIATAAVVGGALRISRAITTYQYNADDEPDAVYLDSETLHSAAYVLRHFANAVTLHFDGQRVAADGTRFGAGSAMVTPAIMRGVLYGAYKELEELGLVEDFGAFKAGLVVEIDPDNEHQFLVSLLPAYVRQLRVVALLHQLLVDTPVIDDYQLMPLSGVAQAIATARGEIEVIMFVAGDAAAEATAAGEVALVAPVVEVAGDAAAEASAAGEVALVAPVVDVSGDAAAVAAAAGDVSVIAPVVTVAGDAAAVAAAAGDVSVIAPVVTVAGDAAAVAAAAGAVSVSGGGALFVGQSTGVLSLYSLATTPVLAGSLSGLGTITCVSRTGNYAFVATSTAGIRIVDVSNQAAPSLAATLSVQTVISWLKIVGTRLYYSSANVLYVYDISTPTSPSLLGSYNGTTLGKFEVVGNYMYHQMPGSVKKVDVSNPGSMSLVASLSTLFASIVLNIGAISSGYLIVSGSDTTGGLTLLKTGVSRINLSAFAIENIFWAESDNVADPETRQLGSTISAILNGFVYFDVPYVSNILGSRTAQNYATTTSPSSIFPTDKVRAIAGNNSVGYGANAYLTVSGGFDVYDCSTVSAPALLSSITLASISALYAG